MGRRCSGLRQNSNLSGLVAEPAGNVHSGVALGVWILSYIFSTPTPSPHLCEPLSSFLHLSILPAFLCRPWHHCLGHETQASPSWSTNPQELCLFGLPHQPSHTPRAPATLLLVTQCPTFFSNSQHQENFEQRLVWFPSQRAEPWQPRFCVTH